MNEIRLKNEREKEQRYKDWSKDKLIKECESFIKTTMIGSISAIEKELGDLMQNSDIRDRFMEIRERILDQGNTQIRKLKDKLDNYDVEWLRYHIEFRRKS